MLSFRRILFPIDFSERSREVAPYVAWIARKFDGQVTLLHASDMPLASPGSSLWPELTFHQNWIRQQRESDLAAFAPEIFDRLLVTRIAEFGDPAEVIVRYAEHNEVDLIVMPTHGLGTFRWLLLGSVTAKVLHDSLCPVWTTVHSEAQSCGGGREIRTVLCGVDLSSDPVRVIRAASDVAANCGAIVRLVHAIDTPEARPGSDMDTGLKRFLFDTAREQIASCQKEAETAWEVCIHSGGVSSVLRHAALRSHADLLVIGRGHLRHRLGRLRTNVGVVIRESPCPVLSV